MNRFDIILDNIKKKINNDILYNYVFELLKSWFINLNLNDIKTLTILSTYLAKKINKLFIEQTDNDDTYLLQYKQKSNQDMKAIILLLLPYI
jgi:hypothetical protein